MSRIESIRRMLQDSPNDTFLLYSLGMELLADGQQAEAILQFQRVIELDSGYLAAYPQAAQAQAEMGDKPGAAAILRSGLAVAEEKGDGHTKDRLELLLKALGEQA